MNYIRKHWRGELSLAVSFWVNFGLLNFVFAGIAAMDKEAPSVIAVG